MSVLAEAAKEATKATDDARADLQRARHLDAPVSEWELLQRCQRACALSGVRCTDQESEDLASILAEKVAEKHGTWTPPRRAVALSYLRTRAARLAVDRTDWQSVFSRRGKVRTVIEPLPAPADGESVLASAIGANVPAINVDAQLVADALRLDADASATVACALSGYGSALEYAHAAGISHGAARKRLSRGAQSIRNAYPDAAAFLEALDTLLADPADETLDVLLAALMRAVYVYRGAANLDREPRLSDGAEHECHTRQT